MVCDSWSCGECGLIRGDGEDVLHLAQERAPSHIFMDFDGTLCSTKAGARPVVGRDTLDPDLLAVLRRFPSTIVTRNSNLEDIQMFLRSFGIDVKVRSVKREKLSKADVVAGMLTSSGCVVFVDDDIRELADTRLRVPSLLRIHFSRVL